MTRDVALDTYLFLSIFTDVDDKENIELGVRLHIAYLGSDDIQRQVEEEQRNDSVPVDHLRMLDKEQTTRFKQQCSLPFTDCTIYEK